MAFDRTNPTQLAALKSELTVDPAGVGYASIQNTNLKARSVSDPAANPGTETTGSPITARVLWELCADHAGDLTIGGQFTQGEQFVVQQLFELTQDQNEDISWARARFRAFFPAQAGIVAALDALLRKLSRAEVLFGIGTVITAVDVELALAS